MCTAIRTLLSCCNVDTFEPDPTVLATSRESSTSKGTWGMVLLILRGLLRRPSLSGTPNGYIVLSNTFTMSWLRNVMHLLELLPLAILYGYMKEHNVDFIGLVTSTRVPFLWLVTCFLDPESFSTWQFIPVGTWCTGGAES